MSKSLSYKKGETSILLPICATLLILVILGPRFAQATVPALSQSPISPIFWLYLPMVRERTAWLAYLPIVGKQPTLTPTPTPTLTLTPTPTSTPIPTSTPTPTPDWFYFLNYPYDIKMKGVWTEAARRSSLVDSWGDIYYPQGEFYIVLMTVINCDLESAYVSRYTFQVGEGENHPRFDMASLDAQWAAQYEYDRLGVYDDLQPIFAYDLVFVFDVPVGGDYGLWYQPWSSTSHTAETALTTLTKVLP